MKRLMLGLPAFSMVFSLGCATTKKAVLERSTEVTYIPFESTPQRASDLREFLLESHKTVEREEPRTAVWFALASEDDPTAYAIIDFFPDSSARSAHYGGKVAGWLKDNAPIQIKGSWAEVTKNTKDSRIVSSVYRKFLEDNTKLATYISFKGKRGQDKNIEDLLINAANIVRENEPHTYMWYGLKSKGNEYAIFAVFKDAEGRNEHFHGKVIQALKDQSQKLVQGGWDKGVWANVEHYRIIGSLIRR